MHIFHVSGLDNRPVPYIAAHNNGFEQKRGMLLCGVEGRTEGDKGEGEGASKPIVVGTEDSATALAVESDN